MNTKELEQLLFEWSPKSYAEDFDNVGLLVGNPFQEVRGVLITLDCTLRVVEEAIENKLNTIITFHPIIFSGLKSITGKNYVEQVVLKAIENKITIISIHTNLDNNEFGVNYEICNRLGLVNQKILIPRKKQLLKLVTYIPIEYFERVQNELFNSGVGQIGNYEECSTFHQVTGTFKPKEQANPFIGINGIRENVNEIMFQGIFEEHLTKQVVHKLKEIHPYEEVAYDLIRLENENQTVGMGKVGDLSQKMSEIEFLEFVKKIFNCSLIKHSNLLNKKVEKVAVLGGSGSFAIEHAMCSQSDVFITSDLKYHDFFKAENKIILVDVGHYESEQYTKNLIFEFLNKKNCTFAVQISKINTNPANYI